MPDCLFAFSAWLFNILESKLFRHSINGVNEICSPSDDGQENHETDETDVGHYTMKVLNYTVFHKYWHNAFIMAEWWLYFTQW